MSITHRRFVRILLVAVVIMLGTSESMAQDTANLSATGKPANSQRLNRDLIDACKRHDAAAVMALLRQGADANARDEPSVVLSSDAVPG